MSLIPTTRKLARLTARDGALTLDLGEGPVPAPGPREVLVRMAAVSLNYRDLMVLGGHYPLTANDGLIPVSDGAGIIVAVGADVTRWRVGDRVAPTFFRDWQNGPFDRSYLPASRGAGETDGVLADVIAAPEHSLVAVPDGISLEEAATLPCAAVTAWHALMVRGTLKAGDTVLVQGTGGVALFGLQLATARGARVIVTSSSDAKLERVRAMGAWGTVNYRSTPDWGAAVMDLTGGKGVSHILELGGADTFERSLSCMAAGAHIALIGGLTGFDISPALVPLLWANASVDGIAIGSAEHFAALNGFIAQHGIKPVIDRVFPFEEARMAYDHLASGNHFGKVVISL